MKSQTAPVAADVSDQGTATKQPKNYRGFVGGVFSGIAKLSGRTLDILKLILYSES